MPVVLAEVRDAAVEAGELAALVARPDAGALVEFVGVVRNHDPQATGEVVALDYTCHPSAPQRIGEVVAEVLAGADPDGACTVAAVHRIGHLVVGDNAFVVAVASAHRRLAFTVCAEVVEQVKAQLPVWKQQFEADGSYRWSGL
ncbi:MAG: molybdenum cofactor biosynthesis protein MoaE [Actinobacteria bacterium]|nr:molybdenum cofactor biosynthesis protein MoaE [Actinomycetota bacterium]